MSKKKFFKNKTKQGDFGEYLYIKFCKKNNIGCNRVNKFGRDIDLANAKIDVKTSRTKKLESNHCLNLTSNSRVDKRAY